MNSFNITAQVIAKCNSYGITPEEIAEARLSGNSISEVSRIFNIPRTSLSSLLKEMGLGEVPATWGKQNELDVEWLRRELVDNDRTIDDVARELCVGRNVVWRAATAAGVMEEKKSNRDKSICQRKNVDPEWIRKQVEARRTNKDIALELGWSTSMVTRACKEEGIARKKEYKEHRKKENWTVDAEIERYRTQLENGELTLPKLSEKTHIPYTTLKRICDKHSIQVKNGSPTLFEKYNITPEWLIEQRLKNNRTCEDIAKEIGCPKGSVYRQCKNLGVDGLVKDRTLLGQIGVTREWLFKEHLLKGRSCGDIAKELGIKRDNVERACNHYCIMTPVQYACNEGQISEQELFELIDGEGMECTRLSKKLGINQTLTENIFLNYDINGLIGRYDPRRFCLSIEWLYEQRINKKRSVAEISQETGLAYSLMKKICDTNDLYVREVSTAEQYGLSNEWFKDKRDVEHVSQRELAKQLKGQMSRATIKKIYHEIDAVNACQSPVVFKENRNALFRNELEKIQPSTIISDNERKCQYGNISRAEKYGIDYEWLYKNMIIEKKTANDVCNLLGISQGTLGDICAEIGFEKHKMSLCEQHAINPELLGSLRQQGKSYQEIAKTLNISQSMSKYMCYEEGIDSIDMEKFYETYDTDYETLQKMRVENRCSIEVMSMAIGCSQDKMKCVCYTLNFPRPNQVPYSKRFGVSREQIEEIAKEPKSNMSYISKKLGLNSRIVERIMLEYGIAVPHNRTHSVKEDEWEKFLSDHNIPYSLRQQCLRIGNNNAGQEIDILIKEHNLGIEISPAYTHNHDVAPHWGNETKDVLYHQNKAKAAEQLGINLIHIFDWHDVERMKNLILSLCGTGICLDDEECEIRVVNDSMIEQIFLDNNHLQGYVPSTIAYGLYLQDELIALMSFSDVVENSIKEWTILRFASKNGIIAKNSINKLFERFCEREKPYAVTVAVDYNVSNGMEYEELGFEHVRTVEPSCYWVRNNGSKESYSNSFVQENGIEAIGLPRPSDDICVRETMLSEGFVRVYDCGSKIYHWTNQ